MVVSHYSLYQNMWDAHINSTSQKANQTSGFLRRKIIVKSQSINSIAYQTLVRPRLNMVPNYGLPTANQIDQIENSEKEQPDGSSFFTVRPLASHA
jgi:hypothetical protein